MRYVIVRPHKLNRNRVTFASPSIFYLWEVANIHAVTLGADAYPVPMTEYVERHHARAYSLKREVS